jgi:hypothetical protein
MWRSLIPWLTELIPLRLAPIGSALLVIHYHDGNKPAIEVTKAPPQVQLVEQRSLQNALLAIQRAEREYVEAIRVLSGIVEVHKTSLDPKLAAELERNLKAIDEAIASTQKAYHEHPTDPELAQYMLAAYQKGVPTNSYKESHPKRLTHGEV